MPNPEAPKSLYVQLTSGGGTISYLRDPREVHDNGKPVYEYVPASLLSARDQEVREVLEGLRNGINDCWCPTEHQEDKHLPACLAARALYEKVQVVKEGNDGER